MRKQLKRFLQYSDNTTTAVSTTPLATTAVLRRRACEYFIKAGAPDATPAATRQLVAQCQAFPDIATLLYIRSIRTRDHWHYARLLVDNDCVDINTVDPHTGNTGLLFAAQRAIDHKSDPGAALALAFYIDHEADISATNHKGDNALMWTAYQGNIEASLRLIHAGIDVNHRNLHQLTPLYAAVNQGHEAMVQLLVHPKLGNANVVCRPWSSTISVLHYAAQLGRATLLPILYRHPVKIDIPDSHGKTPLMHAVDAGHARTAMACIELGANPLLNEGACRHSCLTHAVTHKHDYTLALAMLDGYQRVHGLQRECTGVGDTTPLDATAQLTVWSYQHGYDAITQYSEEHIEEHANTTRIAFYQRTMLFAAAMGSFNATINVLAHAKHAAASGITQVINARTTQSQTPLHLAVQAQHEQIAETLIANGADIFATNCDDESPLLYAFNLNTNAALNLYTAFVAHCADADAVQAARRRLTALLHSDKWIPARKYDIQLGIAGYLHKTAKPAHPKTSIRQGTQHLLHKTASSANAHSAVTRKQKTQPTPSPQGQTVLTAHA